MSSIEDSQQSPYKTEPPSEELGDLPPGAELLPRNMRYHLLFTYSQRIKRLTDSDGSEELGGLGIALLAGGIGAVLAGQDVESKGVALSLIVGVVLVVAGILVRRSNTESARNLKRDFNRDLSLVEKGSQTIRSLREELIKHEAEEREAERPWWQPRRKAKKPHDT